MTMALLKTDEERTPEQALPVEERMAMVMLDCLYEKGTWKLADLRAANFTYDDISRYLEAACTIVERRPRPSQR